MSAPPSPTAPSHLKLPGLFRVLLPAGIGLGVTYFLFRKEFRPEVWREIHFTAESALSLLLAFCLMLGRDFWLSWRFRWLARPDRLGWRPAIRVNLLCEFTSAVTPSAVGGSGLIPVFLKGEGIPAGKGTALMISTLFLDELYFVLLFPIFFFIFPAKTLFGSSVALTSAFQLVFILIYLGITAWTLLLYIALFRRPDWASRLIIRIFRLRWLRRWNGMAERMANDLQMSAAQMDRFPVSFWIKAFLGTAAAWICRYLVACALFLPYVSWQEQPLIFARQLILWIVMMISPTPGGSGVSEYVFSAYYSDLLANTSLLLIITCCWRIVTYYIYLFAGISLLPGWIRKFKLTLSTGQETAGLPTNK